MTLPSAVTQEDALEKIKSLAVQHELFTVASSYKGLILAEEVQPIDSGIDHVVFEAPGHTFWTTIHETVFLHSRILAQTIRARLRDVNFSKQQMSLTNFIFTGSTWKDRWVDRVQPADVIPVNIGTREAAFLASLQDVSLHGIGLLVERKPHSVLSLYVDLPVKITFRLPGEKPSVVNAKVVSMHPAGNCLVRLGVRTYLNSKQERLMEQYIHQRRIEIKNELGRVCLEAQEPRQTKSLFF